MPTPSPAAVSGLLLIAASGVALHAWRVRCHCTKRSSVYAFLSLLLLIVAVGWYQINLPDTSVEAQGLKTTSTQ